MTLNSLLSSAKRRQDEYLKDDVIEFTYTLKRTGPKWDPKFELYVTILELIIQLYDFTFL